jgi:hypothetical protein
MRVAENQHKNACYMRYYIYSNFWNNFNVPASQAPCEYLRTNLELHIMLIPCRGHGACLHFSRYV